jgi:ABC-type lipoprotein release transport system permease subunit
MRLLLAIAWRNLGRNPRRTAINLSAVAFATLMMITMSAIQSGSYNQMIEGVVRMQSGHLQVQAAGYLDDNDIALSVPRLTDVYSIVDRQPGVVGAAGRISTGMLAAKEEDSFAAMVIGTDAVRERKTSNWTALMREGSFLDPADADGALVGGKLAQTLKAQVGDKLFIFGQGATGAIAAANLRVRGIIESGVPEIDRTAVMVNLALLQDALSMPDRATCVAIRLRGHELAPAAQADLEAKLRRLSPNLRVVNWRQLNPGIDQGIEMDNFSGKILVFVLVLVVAFGILNTFLMGVIERYREFGVMLAIGVKPGTCAGTVLVEGQMLAVVGFLAGLAVAAGLNLFLGVHGIPITDAKDIYAQYGLTGSIYPAVTSGIVWRSFLQVWGVTTLAAAYPSARILRFRPVDALRSS